MRASQRPQPENLILRAEGRINQFFIAEIWIEWFDPCDVELATFIADEETIRGAARPGKFLQPFLYFVLFHCETTTLVPSRKIRKLKSPIVIRE
ncbi:hypothetical protein [Rhizobium nepotum]|uniref:hypothetical protein n=1 Tax=Rhizobium nepotum TaxID=1035271 RepID=UPI003CE6F3F3